MLIPNLISRYIFIFGFGCCNFGYVSAYILICEVIPKRLISLITACLMFTDSFLQHVVPPLLVKFVTDNWILIGYIWLGVLVAPICILAWFVTESPELLVEQGKYDEARKVLQNMA